MGRWRLAVAGLLVTAMTASSAPLAHADTMVDDFEGPAGTPPNPALWTVVEGSGWDAGVEEYAAPNAVLDGQGNLAITARRDGSGFTSGRVQTKNKASFGYGTLVARIKMPSGQGLWPAFWLVGADEDNNPWPGAGEIDVVEMVSDARTHYSSLHGPTPGTGDHLQAQIVGDGPDLSDGFHNYWMTHIKDSITVGVDDTKWGTLTPDSLPPQADWVFHKPFYVIMNLAVGGDWAGPPDRSTPLPAVMLVDWVKWQPA